MKNKIINILSNKQTATFTKKWTSRLLWFGVIWVSCSYILAFMGRSAIAESLSKLAMTVIIGTFVPYLTKAYFETKEQKKNELKEKGIK